MWRVWRRCCLFSLFLLQGNVTSILGRAGTGVACACRSIFYFFFLKENRGPTGARFCERCDRMDAFGFFKNVGFI